MQPQRIPKQKHSLLIHLVAILCLATFFSLPVRAELRGNSPKAEAVVQTQARVLPDHDISYEDSQSPEWKSSWDAARQLYRDKKYKEALIQYEILLHRKGSVDEARWEYTSILLRLERWEQAIVQLEKLLAHDKANRNYQFALAEASLACGQTDKALRMYNRLYQNVVKADEKKRCLEGMVQVLEIQGNQAALLPLLEQLLSFKPSDSVLLKKKAGVLVHLDHISRAQALLDSLIANIPEDADLIRLEVQLHKKMGDSAGAVEYLRKLIAIDPENYDAHSELRQYYAAAENWTAALDHLEAMLRMTPDNADLLSEAAEFNMKLGRIDGALTYYEYALAIRPWDTVLRQKKKDAQKILARDLLVLVENNGTDKLWQDLVQVTTDRPGIYREIAALLRNDDQVGELIEVLRLLYHENPSDSKTYAELATLLKEQGRAAELADLQVPLKDTGVSRQ